MPSHGPSHGPREGRGSTHDRRTRRSILRATGATAAGVASSSLLGTASAAPVESLDHLSTMGNKIVDESEDPVQLNGVSLIDPSRSYRKWRGKTIVEQFDLAVSDDWEHNIVRLPCRPEDISASRTPQNTRNESMMAHGDIWGPIKPDTFDEDDLIQYLSDFVDPVVEKAKDEGVYLMIDYHTHQPVFYQRQFEVKEHRGREFWQDDPYNCGESGAYDWDWDKGMCGHRGVLWHGPDQIADIENLQDVQIRLNDPDNPDPWFDPWCGAGGGEDLVGEEIDLFWETVADRYGGDSTDHVVFDIYNDPTGPYFGDWGTPDRMPVSLDPGQSNDGAGGPANDKYAKAYWDLWMERSKRWINTAAENAPERFMTIGNPRWSQWTFWAGALTYNGVNGSNSLNGIDAGASNIGYSAHAHNQEGLRPLALYFGVPSLTVPVLFTQFGWESGGGPDWLVHLGGVTEVWGEGDESAIEEWGRPEGRPNPNDLSESEQDRMNHFGVGGDLYPPKEAYVGFRAFFENFPVHPFGWRFDHSWSPRFFSNEDTENWELMPYNDAPGQWWQEYLADHARDAPPGGDNTWQDIPGARSENGVPACVEADLFPDGYLEAISREDIIGWCIAPPPPPPGQDLDGDGLYEDINENDQLDFPDVNTFFQNTDSDWVQDNTSAYDFNDDGEISLQDVMTLFEMV